MTDLHAALAALDPAERARLVQTCRDHAVAVSALGWPRHADVWTGLADYAAAIESEAPDA
jgi:hypothetical protein